MRLHSPVIAGIYLADCGGCSNAAKPDTVAMLGDMTPSGLTGDRDHLYVTGYTNADEFGEVRKISKKDGAVRKLARARNSAAPIVHGDKLYWMTAFWIARMPADGTKPIGVVKASADAFIVDGDHLVWEDGGAIYTGPMSGDSRTELWRSPDVDGVSAFAADATHIYAAMSMSGTILAIPKSGGEAVVLVKTVQPRALVVDETKVYWLSQGSAEVPGGGVFSMAKSGGKPTPLLRWPGIDGSDTMVTDGKSLYLVRGHEVVRVAKSGGVRRIAKLSHKCGAGYLYLDQYLDATNVYWISCDSDMHTIVQKVKR